MICPMCQQECSVDPQEFVLDLASFAPSNNYYFCYCLNQTAPTFRCYIEKHSKNISAFYFNLGNIYLNYIKSISWEVYCRQQDSSQIDPLLGKGNNQITPEEGYQLIQRYKKLLIFS